MLTTGAINQKPSADLVAKVRTAVGATQRQAAASIGALERSWRRFEKIDGSMGLAEWWLFLLQYEVISLSDLPLIPDRKRAGRKMKNESLRGERDDGITPGDAIR